MTALLEVLASIPAPVQLLLTAALSVIGTVLVSMGKFWTSRGMTEENARASFRAQLMERISEVQAGHDKCTADLADMQHRLGQAETRIIFLNGSIELMQKQVEFFREQAGSFMRREKP